MTTTRDDGSTYVVTYGHVLPTSDVITGYNAAKNLGQEFSVAAGQQIGAVGGVRSFV